MKKFSKWSNEEKKEFRKKQNEKRKQGILESLENLFNQAENLGMWFCCPDNRLIASPRQLKVLQSKNFHRHSNWILIDIQEEIEKINSKISQLEAERDKYINEIKFGNQEIQNVM